MPCALDTAGLSTASAFLVVLELAGPVVGFAILVMRGERWLLDLSPSSETSATPPAARARTRSTALCLLGIVALATIPCLGASTLFDRDEGYYAESARGMLERGDVFVPRVAGEAWLEKPPLTFWTMMLSMATLGRSELAARLPSALFGLLLIALTMQLGRRLIGPRGAFLAGLVLASSLLIALTMRFALLDTTLACCVTLSMLGLWSLWSERAARGFWLFYVGCGLGVIAKGPLGPALPVLSLIGLVTLTRRWRFLAEIKPVRGALLALAVAGLWAVPAIVLTHGEYLRELVWVRTIRPIFSPLQGHGGGSVWSYLALLPIYVPILLVGLGAWAPFLIPALRERALRGDRRQFLLGWSGAQFIALSLVSTKLPHYLVPMLPPIALLIAAFLDERLHAQPAGQPMWTRARANAVVVGALVLGSLMLAVPALLGFSASTLYFAPAALVFVAGGFLVRHHAVRGRAVHAVVSAAAMTLLGLALLSIVGLPQLDQGKSASHIASALHQRYPGSRFDSLRVALVDYRQYSLLYYLEHDAIQLERARLSAFLDQQEPAVVVLPQSQLDAAEREGSIGTHDVIWRQRSWISDKNRWVDIAVVSNGR